MTTPRRKTYVCQHCRNETPAETEWEAWVRDNPRLPSKPLKLSVQDVDMWFHRVMSDTKGNRVRKIMHVMLVEVKQFLASPSWSQKDTFHVAHQIFRAANGKQVLDLEGRECTLRAWGYMYLRMDGASPASSKRLWWNGQELSTEWLEEVLKFERRPDDPRSKDINRSHHKRRDVLQLTLTTTGTALLRQAGPWQS